MPLSSPQKRLQETGKCWHCKEPKANPYGLCGGCGRFGLSDNECVRNVMLTPESERKRKLDIARRLYCESPDGCIWPPIAQRIIAQLDEHGIDWDALEVSNIDNKVETPIEGGLKVWMTPLANFMSQYEYILYVETGKEPCSL